MKRTELYVKTKQGQAFARLTKSLDAHYWQLQQAMVEGVLDDDEFLLLMYGVESVCDGALDKLAMEIDALCLKEGHSNERQYKNAMKAARTGIKFSMHLCTPLGETMFSLSLTMDRVCLAVHMLLQERRIELKKAKDFFKHVTETIRHFQAAEQELAHVVQNIKHS